MTVLEHYTTTSTVKAHKTTFREEDSMLKIKGNPTIGQTRSSTKPMWREIWNQILMRNSNWYPKKIMSTTTNDLKPRATDSLRKFQSGKAYRRVIEISVIVADKLTIFSMISVQASTTNIIIHLHPEVAVIVCWPECKAGKFFWKLSANN